MAKVGRPRKEIDWEEVDKLLAIHANEEEVAGWFECSVDTIYNRCLEDHGMNFSEYYKQKRSTGRISLRRKQFQTAMNGNVSMLIWLGKQWLGQVDKQEISANLVPIELNYALDEKDVIDVEPSK